MSSLIDVADPLDIFGSRSAADATEAQSESAADSLAELRRQFDIQQENIRPFREQALPALGQFAQLSGAQGQDQQLAAFGQFRDSPGQAFLRDRGQRSIERNAQAFGSPIRGNVQAALDQRGAGLAEQDFESQMNRLAGISGIAQTAASQLGGASQQFASDVGNQSIQQGNIRASGLAAQQASRANLAGTAAGLFGQFSQRQPAPSQGVRI